MLRTLPHDRIRGSRISVWFIIRQLRTGDSPEIIAEGYPHLSLAGIYDAISYYHDHRAEIDPIIEHMDAQAEKYDELARQTGADSIVVLSHATRDGLSA